MRESIWLQRFLIFLATAFLFVIVPVMENQGRSEEEAAATMGASGWTIFRRVTLPNIKWALGYGIILCSARALGEFGAVSVVSGHIRGKTNTLPLHIEILYNEYNFTAAFAVASVLVFLAIIILILRNIVENANKNPVEEKIPTDNKNSDVPKIGDLNVGSST